MHICALVNGTNVLLLEDAPNQVRIQDQNMSVDALNVVGEYNQLVTVPRTANFVVPNTAEDFNEANSNSYQG